jgi:hypothetical protein
MKPALRILLFFVILLMVGSVPAHQSTLAASGSPRDTSNIFILSISQARPEVCVGETVTITISWAPNSAKDYGGLAPLTPLAGPSRISLKASHGFFYPQAPNPPGSVSGTTSVTYTAESEGTEKIFAQAWLGGSSDAIATDSFEVKACEYYYTLDSQLDMTVTSEGLSYTARYKVKSWGTLVPVDSEHPRQLEARDKLVKLSASIISWSSSECVLFTFEPASGSGRVDARLDPGAMGIGNVLKLAPPVDLAWDMDLSFACNGHGNTVAGVYPIASSDPWVQATFPEGVGTQDVVLEMFETPYQRLVGSEGITISYTAKLSLEKKEHK